MVRARVRAFAGAGGEEKEDMAESVYKVIELVGTSEESWEKAAKAAVERAGASLRDLRIAEVSELDMQIKDGKVDTYRAKVKVSFKFE
jgi:flavin-binding protein dodecin